MNNYLEIILLGKDALNCSKVTWKTFIMLQQISISNKWSSFEISINQRILKKVMFPIIKVENFFMEKLLFSRFFD